MVATVNHRPATRAGAEGAAIAYQHIVLGAWREIDDALNAYITEQQQNAKLAALASARVHWISHLRAIMVGSIIF